MHGVPRLGVFAPVTLFRPLPDVLAANLRVLFVGINPSLYSAEVGHHFARPGNRFWPTLHGSGFTPHLVVPQDDHTVLTWGLGLTNLVDRATARASELEVDELRDGGQQLVQKLEDYRPRVVAMVGVSAYRVAFADKRAAVGDQARRLGPSRLWLLPNPSGLNAHYRLQDLVAAFGELARASALAPP